MDHTTRWTARIYIYEHDDTNTRAEVRLQTQDGNQRTGIGIARRNPHDANVPEIGDELAVARAFADLSDQLLRATAVDVEAMTSRPAHIDG